nr:hypothetical protein [uncultured Acidovorax sp.]
MKEKEKELKNSVKVILPISKALLEMQELEERFRSEEEKARAIAAMHQEVYRVRQLQLARQKKNLIARAPGYRMLHFIQGMSPPKFRERELTALMGDASEAYFQALASGSKWDIWRLKILTPVWVLSVALKGAASALVGVFTKAVKTGSE